jgi:hypothetical protein
MHLFSFFNLFDVMYLFHSIDLSVLCINFPLFNFIQLIYLMCLIDLVLQVVRYILKACVILVIKSRMLTSHLVER